MEALPHHSPANPTGTGTASAATADVLKFMSAQFAAFTSGAAAAPKADIVTVTQIRGQVLPYTCMVDFAQSDLMGLLHFTFDRPTAEGITQLQLMFIDSATRIPPILIESEHFLRLSVPTRQMPLYLQIMDLLNRGNTVIRATLSINDSPNVKEPYLFCVYCG